MSKRIDFNTWTDVYAFINLQCELEDNTLTRHDYAALMLLNERETADLLAEVPSGTSSTIYRRINAAFYRAFSKRMLRPLAHDVRALGSNLIDANCANDPATFRACMGLDDFIQQDSDGPSANSKVAAVALAKSRAVTAAQVKPGYELETIYNLSDADNSVSAASYSFGHQQSRNTGFKFGAMKPSAQRGNRRS